jgi:PAS domain S-box-containing protein
MKRIIPQTSMSAEKRIIMVFVLSALASIVLVGAGLNFFLQRHEFAQCRADLEARANLLARQCESEITEARLDLEFMSRMPAFQQMEYVNQIDLKINGIPENTDTAKRKFIEQINNKTQRFSTLFILRPNGEFYLEHPFQAQLKIKKYNLSDRAYFRESVQTGKTAISGFLVGATGNLAVAILVPLHGKSGGIIGYLGGNFYLNKLSLLVTRERIRPFNAGFLIDRQGQLIAHTDIAMLSNTKREIFFNNNSMVSGFLALATNAEGIRQSVYFNDNYISPFDKKHYMSVMVPLAPGWGLGLMRDRAEVVKEINPVIWGITSLAGLLLAIIGGLGAVIAHGIGHRWDKAENDLRSSEERFRIASETSNDAVYEWDMKNIVQWYGKIDRMLGYGPGEFPRTLDDWAKSVHPDDIDRVMAEVTAHLEKLAVYSSEYRVRRKDGTYRWWSARGEAARTPDGKPFRWVGTVTDITERKNQEEELKNKNEELTRFTYSASHDLKSPLVSIKTFLGFLEQDIKKADNAAIGKDMGYIQSSADKMARLLDELLNLSRIGRKLNAPVEISLQDAVKEAADTLAGQITKRNVKVVVSEKPVILYGDRPRLVEIFQNLIDNAVKFMGDQAEPLVEIGLAEVSGLPEIFVRDNGIGIDPRHQHKLFSLFEKLDASTEGTGIGLVLVKRIIEVHGGNIRVESEGAGKGATFFFTLAKTVLKIK